MRTRKIGLLVTLSFLVVGALAGKWLFSPSPKPNNETLRITPSMAQAASMTSSPMPALSPEAPEESFIHSRKHRGRLMDRGVATEKNFLGEIRDWARKDPEAALAWAQDQPSGDEARKEAFVDACFQIAQTDPGHALMLADQLHLDPDAVLANLAQQWAVRDLAAARDWVVHQSNGDSRNAMMTGVAFVWSHTDPAAAAQSVVEQMSPGSAEDATVMMVVHQWATIDLAGATTWVTRYPAGPLRDKLLSELMDVEQYQ